MHAQASKAAAEAAALDGLQSSPDTQECRAIFDSLIGVEFDTVDFGPAIDTSREQSSLVQTSGDAFIFKKPTLPDRFHSAVLAAARYSLSQSEHQLQSNKVQKPLNRSDCQLQPQNTGVANVTRAQLAGWTPQRDARGRLRNCDLADGTQSHPNIRSGNMEEVLSQLYSSDGSNLSKTQENDPAVYERLLTNKNSTTAPYPIHTTTLATQDTPLHIESGMTAIDTARSYAPDDTGHLTLDYKPPLAKKMQQSFEEVEVEDGSQVPLIPRGPYMAVGDPHTPSQPRPNLGRPGTVMKLSQMFAETQPSPGSRDPQTVLPSSSRPSPDLFGHQRTPKDLASSPLFRRSDKTHDANIATFDIGSSSPNLPLNPGVNQPDASPPSHSNGLPVLANGTNVPFGPTSFIPRFPEPYDMYIPRKESQERRMQQAHAGEDDSQFSDDDFSDSEMERNRRAKLKKEQAAKTLAIVGASRPASSGKEIVEVPSTSNGRRRSQADEYVAQCLGHDARDSQQDDTVADSQSLTAANVRSAVSNSSQGRSRSLEKSASDPSRRRSTHDELTALPEGLSVQSSGQLPGLEQNDDSDATESDSEGSPAPMQRPVTQALVEVSSNIADLRTPAVTKKILAVDGVNMVPETSPSEAHLHKYGEIVSQTPPVLSTEDSDDAFNLFTQDVEFNQILSPSPQRRTRSRPIRSARASTETKPEHDPALLEKSGSKTGVSLIVDPILAGLGDPELDYAAKSNPDSTAQEYTSEFATAPTNIPAEASSEVNPTPTERVGHRRIKTYKVIKRPRWSPIPSPLSSVPQQEGNNSDKDVDIPSISAVDEKPEVRGSNDQSKNKSIHLHRLSESIASQSEGRSAESLNDHSEEAAGEPLKVATTRLRSADQLKGSSRALRRLPVENKGSFHKKASENITPVSTAKRSLRTSGRVSEQAKSVEVEEPTTPVVSTRRKSATNRPPVTGIFSKMVFSVSYGNQDDEKERIISVIKQNGGRILEKGFDELFDMTASELTLSTTSSRNSVQASENALVLTAEAVRTTFACLIADVHSRRAKFMQALALGLPCLSGRWVEHCVAKGYLLDWDVYLLASGESSFLGGAVRSRSLQPYPAATAKFSECIEQRRKLLSGKSILIVMGRGRAEERKRAYLFLTQALGARCVRRTQTNQEARKVLLEAEANGEEYNWVYVDGDERDAERIIFGIQAPPTTRKRKRSGSTEENEDQNPPPKKVKVISDEFVIQSLILGKLIDD